VTGQRIEKFTTKSTKDAQSTRGDRVLRANFVSFVVKIHLARVVAGHTRETDRCPGVTRGFWNDGERRSVG
jgi:hypothetical protein